MANWNDRIKAMKVELPTTKAKSPFLEGLEEFCAAMEGNFSQLRMRIVERSEAPLSMYAVVTAPKYFRDRDSTMLTIVDRFTSAELLSRSRSEVKSKDEFMNALAEFFTSPNFRQTLQVYADDCAHPVEGVLLFRGYDGGASADDVLVEVPPDTQRRLFELATSGAAPEERALAVSLRALPRRKTGKIEYNEAYQYLDLESGGFVLRIEGKTASDGGTPPSISFKGTVAPEVELD